jgi:pimeloyl-ACP methyl ester carboxylesterase
MSSFTKRILPFAVLTIFFLSLSQTASAQLGVTTHTGALPDGATYLIEVPANWNGTLFLYSHGYTIPGTSNPAEDAGDQFTRFLMLSSGFALAGSSYASTGWAIHEAIPDQIAVLDLFKQLVGSASRTIAWGHSLGGMVTAGLIQRYPERFDAALPMCGVLSGGVATWNSALDYEFAFKTLLAPGSGLELVNISDPAGNLALAEAMLDIAQATPQGRARLALVHALADGPGWFISDSPEPAPSDSAAQEANQFLWAQLIDVPFVFAFRAELESRAQGNASWNTGVDYRSLLARSIDRGEVAALYQQAGLNLDADLQTLQDTARISADTEALHYLESNIIFDGEIHIPVLTMHTKGDGLVVVQNESAYKSVVRGAGNSDLLRQTFVHRAGHCAFTPAETFAAVEALLFRLNTGAWGGLDANTLNAAALAAGPAYNIYLTPLGILPTLPAYFAFAPSSYLRQFDTRSAQCQSDPVCRAQFTLSDCSESSDSHGTAHRADTESCILPSRQREDPETRTDSANFTSGNEQE